MSEYIVEWPDKPAKVVRDGWNVRIEWDFKQREEIVRCRDCIHFDAYGNTFGWCALHDIDCSERRCCAWGERRSE